MRLSENWKDYKLIDTADGERLEEWGGYKLIRPDPQIVWKQPSNEKLWKDIHAKYIRSDKGGGYWENLKKTPESWNISYGDLKFIVRPTGFKHTGLFPEQAVNWDFCIDEISKADRKINVLNMFAYTGGATMACAYAGANVCHLDAAKGMVEWAKQNAALCGLSDKPIRWITDDAMKFLSREVKRNIKYDAVILDPPSYGRGTNGEMWKIEDSIFEMMNLCTSVLSDKPLFIILNSYTTGLSPSVMKYLLNVTAGKKYNIDVQADEIGLRVNSSGMALPCGSTAIVRFA